MGFHVRVHGRPVLTPQRGKRALTGPLVVTHLDGCEVHLVLEVEEVLKATPKRVPTRTLDDAVLEQAFIRANASARCHFRLHFHVPLCEVQVQLVVRGRVGGPRSVPVAVKGHHHHQSTAVKVGGANQRVPEQINVIHQRNRLWLLLSSELRKPGLLDRIREVAVQVHIVRVPPLPQIKPIGVHRKEQVDRPPRENGPDLGIRVRPPGPKAQLLREVNHELPAHGLVAVDTPDEEEARRQGGRGNARPWEGVGLCGHGQGPHLLSQDALPHVVRLAVLGVLGLHLPHELPDLVIRPVRPAF
mmetsp:Transcript_13540/g.38087  ORF Transcript_13540/g.38087 Transcript_13540/m.38087 type:complete len:301 (-) Transcript_13540:842-1744(-)